MRLSFKEEVSVDKPSNKRIVREINVDVDKCNGCHACEVACSGFHARPRYGSFNPSRSRIRVVTDMLNDVYVPVRAGEYSKAECTGRHSFKIDGKQYSECSFCPTSCPSRDLFKEPDSGLPLKCDMCEETPALDKPKCVEWCLAEALIYVETEQEVEEDDQPKLGDVEIGLGAMIDKYGLQKVLDTVARMAKP